MSSSQSPFRSEHPDGYPSLHSLAPPLQTMTTALGHGLGAAYGRPAFTTAHGGRPPPTVYAAGPRRAVNE